MIEIASSDDIFHHHHQVHFQGPDLGDSEGLDELSDGSEDKCSLLSMWLIARPRNFQAQGRLSELCRSCQWQTFQWSSMIDDSSQRPSPQLGSSKVSYIGVNLDLEGFFLAAAGLLVALAFGASSSVAEWVWLVVSKK
jgi:hypothetical protein